MKKNIFYIIAIAILAAAVYCLHIINKDTTIPQELKDFAIKDTAGISKIFMADKNKNEVLLEKMISGKWKLNGKHIARPDAIKILFNTMYGIEVKSPVPKSAYNNVVKEMSSEAIKVEIFHHDKLSKTYYVGGDTHDHMGTYMLIEGSSTPFIMHLPGFNGFVSVRYFLAEDEWRDKTVFFYAPKDIVSINLEYPDSTSFSFRITKADSATLWVVNQSGDTLKNLDTLAMLRYLGSFRNVHFEGFVRGMSLEKVDSIYKSKPICILTVTDKAENIKTVKIYTKPVSKRSTLKYDQYGDPLKFDVDRMYAFISDNINNQDSHELVLIQHYVFDHILKSYSYFMGANQSS